MGAAASLALLLLLLRMWAAALDCTQATPTRDSCPVFKGCHHVESSCGAIKEQQQQKVQQQGAQCQLDVAGRVNDSAGVGSIVHVRMGHKVAQ